MPRRSAKRLLETGERPDYRFTLANERTFLAWVRTSLALMAAGVAVISLVPGPAGVRHGLGVVLIALGALLAATAYRQWFDNEQAMRRGEPLPLSPVPRLVARTLVLAALVALALVLWGLR